MVVNCVKAVAIVCQLKGPSAFEGRGIFLVIIHLFLNALEALRINSNQYFLLNILNCI